MNLYKKCLAKLFLFFAIDTTLASNNFLRFRDNLLERIQKLTMTIDDKIRDVKLQSDIDREAAKNRNYCQVKLINMSILQAKKYYLSIK